MSHARDSWHDSWQTRDGAERQGGLFRAGTNAAAAGDAAAAAAAAAASAVVPVSTGGVVTAVAGFAGGVSTAATGGSVSAVAGFAAVTAPAAPAVDGAANTDAAASPAWQPRDHLPRCREPIERIHIIDISIESVQTWLALMGQLAGRPQGPPASLRITILDVMSRVLAVGKDDRAMIREQVRQQLSAQAAAAGIERFECDVIACFADEMEAGLGRVRVNRAERRRRWEEEGRRRRRRQAASWECRAGCPPTDAGAGTEVWGRHAPVDSFTGGGRRTAGREAKEGAAGARGGCCREGRKSVEAPTSRQSNKSGLKCAKDDSAAKRLHVESRGGGGGDQVASAAAGGVGPSDVDVLAVSCVLKLQDYSDEGEGGASLRETFLQVSAACSLSGRLGAPGKRKGCGVGWSAPDSSVKSRERNLNPSLNLYGASR